MIYNTVVLNLLSQSFTCWVSKGDNNNWPQVPVALSTLDYLLIKIIKLKNSLVLLKNNACFVWNFPNIQLFVLFFSSEELYIEPPVTLLSFGLSLTSPFPINFCCHPLCELLVLTRGSHTLPAWMRKTKLVLQLPQSTVYLWLLWDVDYPSKLKAFKGKVEAKMSSVSSRVFLVLSRPLPGTYINLPTLIRKFFNGTIWRLCFSGQIIRLVPEGKDHKYLYTCMPSRKASCSFVPWLVRYDSVSDPSISVVKPRKAFGYEFCSLLE